MAFLSSVPGMEMDLAFFTLAIPAVMIAGISKGGFGSGAAFVATPILALKLEPELALGLMLPLLMLIDVANLKPYWRKWDVPNSKTIVAGGLGGVLAGVVFYQITSADALRVLIGVISILFVVYQLTKGRIGPSRYVPFRRSVGLLTGVVAGFTSFVSHAGGPPVAMHLLSQKIDKTTYQATTVIVFWAINIMKAVPYAFLGIFTAETLLANLILAPVAVASAFLGVWAHRIVPEALFFGITYALLLGAGGKLLLDGLT